MTNANEIKQVSQIPLHRNTEKLLEELKANHRDQKVFMIDFDGTVTNHMPNHERSNFLNPFHSAYGYAILELGLCAADRTALNHLLDGVRKTMIEDDKKLSDDKKQLTPKQKDYIGEEPKEAIGYDDFFLRLEKEVLIHEVSAASEFWEKFGVSDEEKARKLQEWNCTDDSSVPMNDEILQYLGNLMGRWIFQEGLYYPEMLDLINFYQNTSQYIAGEEELIAVVATVAPRAFNQGICEELCGLYNTYRSNGTQLPNIQEQGHLIPWKVGIDLTNILYDGKEFDFNVQGRTTHEYVNIEGRNFSSKHRTHYNKTELLRMMNEQGNRVYIGAGDSPHSSDNFVHMTLFNNMAVETNKEQDTSQPGVYIHQAVARRLEQANSVAPS